VYVLSTSDRAYTPHSVIYKVSAKLPSNTLIDAITEKDYKQVRMSSDMNKTRLNCILYGPRMTLLLSM
jgi:hypothetical protein